MLKYIAFLRAINVGGRTITMAHLRALFGELNLKNIETFIASGNVIFKAPSQEVGDLERNIAMHLQESLGYEVDTFIRSNVELAEIAAAKPFGELELSSGGNTLYVAFLAAPPTPEARTRLLTYRSDVDDFYVNDLEIYWLCRKGVGASGFSGSRLEKAIGAPATLRNVNTVRRLAAKYPPERAA